MRTEQEERNAVDYHTKIFLNRIKKLNSEFKHIQVTDVKVNINHPAPVKAEPFWKSLFKFKSST